MLVQSFVVVVVALVVDVCKLAVGGWRVRVRRARNTLEA